MTEPAINQWAQARAEALGLLPATAGPAQPLFHQALFARVRSALLRMTRRNRGGANV